MNVVVRMTQATNNKNKKVRNFQTKNFIYKYIILKKIVVYWPNGRHH